MWMFKLTMKNGLTSSIWYNSTLTTFLCTWHRRRNRGGGEGLSPHLLCKVIHINHNQRPFFLLVKIKSSPPPKKFQFASDALLVLYIYCSYFFFTDWRFSICIIGWTRKIVFTFTVHVIHYSEDSTCNLQIINGLMSASSTLCSTGNQNSTKNNNIHVFLM